MLKEILKQLGVAILNSIIMPVLLLLFILIITLIDGHYLEDPLSMLDVLVILILYLSIFAVMKTIERKLLGKGNKTRFLNMLIVCSGWFVFGYYGAINASGWDGLIYMTIAFIAIGLYILNLIFETIISIKNYFTKEQNPNYIHY